MSSSDETTEYKVAQIREKISPEEKLTLGLTEIEKDQLRSEPSTFISEGDIDLIEQKNILIKGQNLSDILINSGLIYLEGKNWKVVDQVYELLVDILDGKQNDVNEIIKILTAEDSPFSRRFDQELDFVPSHINTIKIALEKSDLVQFLSQGPSKQPSQKDSPLMNAYNDTIKFTAIWIFIQKIENKNFEYMGRLFNLAPEAQTQLKNDLNNSISNLRTLEGINFSRFNVRDSQGEDLVRVLSLLEFIKEYTQSRTSKVMIKLADYLIKDVNSIRTTTEYSSLINEIDNINNQIRRPAIQPLNS